MSFMKPLRLATVALAGTAAGSLGAAPSAFAAKPASTSGMFVVGDESALLPDGSAAYGAHVTFWGAQWWKDNELSGGVAPPSFKGFADTANVVPPQCTTGSWSTRPGDSSDPFAAPLPDTIPVVVASEVTKSGPVISGDSPAVVSVQVDPGYESNPGHPGTGTVTGLICPSGVGNT